ncbi:TPA: LysR family transcriptional regulator, partial [Escherichia coli]|nr:LysR family transcriptional regulator [Escherichia coli]
MTCIGYHQWSNIYHSVKLRFTMMKIEPSILPSLA